MNNLSCKGVKMIRFYNVFKFMVLQLLIVLHGTAANSTPRIYLIRHAAVDLKKPGWGTSKNTMEYKESYNVARVEAFNPGEVLQKIENYLSIDTVFCSPQSRALETAEMLFGENVFLKTDSVLAELDYPVVRVPFLQLPVKGWLFVSRVTWMAGINRKGKPGYMKRLDELNSFSDELIKFAQRNGQIAVVAHGMVNRELVKILKERGWEYCEKGKGGYGNLSVNCMKYLY